MCDYEVEKAIAGQIAIEQTLTTNRMSWNLTFQGFMMAAFALTATSEFSAPARDVLEGVICVAGLVVSIATYWGVRASQLQRTALRAHWHAHVAVDSRYPKPFSDVTGSKLGRRPTQVICWTISGMWFVLGIMVAVGLWN